MSATVETFVPTDDPLLFTDAAALKVKGCSKKRQIPT
jgi:hypothetical protein